MTSSNGRTAMRVYHYGPIDGAPVLAVHGMTGHGRRWKSWADHLPEARVLAPDLIGHGRSPYTPPWSIEAQVDALLDVLDDNATGPVVAVGHSYGGALVTHLARRAPERISALVLLDPAMGLDPQDLLTVAESTVLHSTYTNAAEARQEKLDGAWCDVDPSLIDAEIEQHLIETGDDRMRWRISTAAVVGSWGEVARPFVLPPAHIPVTVVQAMKVQPPYVTTEFVDALRSEMTTLRFEEFDCDHMVPQARAAESAELVRALLPRP